MLYSTSFYFIFLNGFKLNLILGICSINNFFVDYSSIHIHYMDKSIGSPLLMKGLTTLVISMSTNLNVEAYNDILGNCVLLIL